MKDIPTRAAKNRGIASASVTGAERVLRYQRVLKFHSLAFPLLSPPLRRDVLRLVDSPVTHYGALSNLEFYVLL